MIHFNITIFADVMAMFRGEFKDDYIRDEIVQRLSEDDEVRDEIDDAITEKYEALGNGEAIGKLFRMSREEFVRFIAFDKDDSELDYGETAANGYAPNVVAIRLGCDFDDEKALC